MSSTPRRTSLISWLRMAFDLFQLGFDSGESLIVLNKSRIVFSESFGAFLSRSSQFCKERRVVLHQSCVMLHCVLRLPPSSRIFGGSHFTSLEFPDLFCCFCFFARELFASGGRCTICADRGRRRSVGIPRPLLLRVLFQRFHRAPHYDRRDCHTLPRHADHRVN
jgi:hypothetical protein